MKIPAGWWDSESYFVVIANELARACATRDRYQAKGKQLLAEHRALEARYTELLQVYYESVQREAARIGSAIQIPADLNSILKFPGVRQAIFKALNSELPESSGLWAELGALHVRQELVEKLADVYRRIALEDARHA